MSARDLLSERRPASPPSRRSPKPSARTSSRSWNATAGIIRERRRRSASGAPRSGGNSRTTESRNDMATILLVDDEASARLTLGLLLKRRGHVVQEADGVVAATKALGDAAFDLVITDLWMPDGQGL